MKKIIFLIQLIAVVILFSPHAYADDDSGHRGHGWGHHGHHREYYYQQPEVRYYQQPPVRYYQQPEVRYYPQPPVRYYQQPPVIYNQPQYPNNSLRLSW
jgi:hypothetical protein